MKLSIGIVGFPNVGKSTLFNALLKKQAAFAANYPFATIEPNTGVVPVPDTNLPALAKVVQKQENLPKPPPEKPAVITFIDIAGLVKGASKGEGLGNQFLAHIRETSAICHVLRDFDDTNILRQGSKNPKDDLETIRIELALKDLETLSKQKKPNKKLSRQEQEFFYAVEEFQKSLENQQMINLLLQNTKDKEKKRIFKKAGKLLNLLTIKPEIFLINIDEEKLKSNNLEKLTQEYSRLLNEKEEKIIVMNAKLEYEISAFQPQEQQEILKEYSLPQPALERLITTSYKILNLISFYTAGKKEVRAWTIRRGSSASTAAGAIHSDFQKLMISAKVAKVEEFIKAGGWNALKEQGKIRIEGRDYILKENEVVEFNITQKIISR